MIVLFAVGLSVYLWSINIGVALPVVITTTLAVLFYGITVSLPLFFRFCPYTTALVRFLYPFWIKLLDKPRTKDFISTMMASGAFVSQALAHPKQFFRAKHPNGDGPASNNDVESIRNNNSIPIFSFHDCSEAAKTTVNDWISLMRGMFLTDRSQLVEPETPMDDLTSLMISWMIANCEDSESVDMALQAIAGADQRLLPRQSLWECGAMQLLLERINTCRYQLAISPSGGPRAAYNTLLDDASLYSRSLSFLTALIRGEGLDLASNRFVCNAPRDMAQVLQGAVSDLNDGITCRLDECAHVLASNRT